MKMKLSAYSHETGTKITDRFDLFLPGIVVFLQDFVKHAFFPRQKAQLRPV